MKIKLSALFLLTVGLSLSCKKDPATSESEFVKVKSRKAALSSYSTTSLELGFNGHPFNRATYKNFPIATQLDLVANMNANYYRIDVPVTAGGEADETTLKTLKTEAESKGVKLLPMLYLKSLDYTVDTNTSYNRGRTLGLGFASRFGTYFDVYELGNQQENGILKAGMHGNNPLHYDSKKFKILLSYLKGLNAGIKAKDAGAKTIINASWLHYTYLKMLEDGGLEFDIIGYQWFSNMDDNARKNFGIDDIGLKLASLFSKPIWFTKVNIHGGTARTGEESQSNWLNNFISRCRSNPSVKAVIVHELLDQTELPSPENSYGIIKWRDNGMNWDYKYFGRTLVSGTPFILGVNGHPMGATSYKDIPATTQARLMTQLNLTYYRVDMLTDRYGKLRLAHPSIMTNLYNAASGHGIRILPMLYPATLDFSSSKEEAYQNGKTLASGFAEQYGKYFDVYELGNEEENAIILPGKHGNVPQDFTQSKLEVLASYVKGMNDGIKSKDANAKTIVSHSWIHHGYIRALVDRGVNFDIVGLNWYSNMEKTLPSVLKIDDITVKLTSLFNKPIWFTEVSYRYGSYLNTQEEQKQWLKTFINKCRKNPNVKAMMIYELFDELDKKDNIERYYGICKWASPYSQFMDKAVANLLRID